VVVAMVSPHHFQKMESAPLLVTVLDHLIQSHLTLVAILAEMKSRKNFGRVVVKSLNIARMMLHK
jgi:hypothetical protein